MKLATVAKGAGTAIAVVSDEDRVIDLSAALADQGHHYRDLGQALAAPDGMAHVAAAARRAADSHGVAAEVVSFLSPVPRPGTVLAVAANYKAHIEETKTITYAPKSESAPWFFTKPQTSLNPHRSPIVLPRTYGTKVDWEAELGVIIGKGGSNIAEKDVWDHIAGYTVINDISARAMDVPQRSVLRERDTFHDWLHGKWFDTFCCIGPWMSTPDELVDPEDVEVSLTLNGELRQQASTKMMIFSIPELIAFASSIVTLQPGDVIATGTPSGVGKATGRFLVPGDVLSVTVPGIGTLTNPVINWRHDQP